MSAPAAQLHVCLCCGSRYPADRDCPRLHEAPHDAGLAARVASYLLAQGTRDATGADVRRALEAVR